ncbi:hypothetical protein N9Y48_00025 [Zobellia sp.]|nr:hypothetical protein [Zobellia sp.]
MPLFLVQKKVLDLKIIQAKVKFLETLKKSNPKYSTLKPTGYFGDLKEVLTMAKLAKSISLARENIKSNPFLDAI